MFLQVYISIVESEVNKETHLIDMDLYGKHVKLSTVRRELTAVIHDTARQ